MNARFTLREILGVAQKIELDGLVFYTQASKILKAPELQKTFSDLAYAEGLHF